MRDPDDLLRIKELAIPPAWEDVWICGDPLGHLQATGIDAAGRKQYLYHQRWREMRDRKKFDRMVDFAHALPRLRRRVCARCEPAASPMRRASWPARSACSTSGCSGWARSSTPMMRAGSVSPPWPRTT
ncbi:MAG: hypothetical protein ACXVRN_00675 [Solirubrobacteraceae bacterium]